MKRVHIILADDNPGEHLIMAEAFQDSRIRGDFHCVADGQELLDYLLHRGLYKDVKKNPKPDLLLLDLNMPKLDGNEVLQRIRNHPDLKDMRVVVLSAFDPKAQMTYSYNLYDVCADAYLVKPSSYDKRVRLLTELYETYFPKPEPT